MQIEIKEVEKLEKRLIKAASFKDIETGDVRERAVIKPGGERVIEQVPIKQRVFYEAVFDDVIVKQNVYAVFDGVETHEFASEKDAQHFINESTKK